MDDEYDPYDYRETDDWFNEPFPESPKEPERKLWQIEDFRPVATPILPPPRATELDNNSTWHLWLLIITIFIVMLILVAIAN